MQQDDRRDAFRVDLTAAVSIQSRNTRLIQAQDYFHELSTLALAAEFHGINSELSTISERIKDLATQKSVDLLRRQMAVLAQMQITQNLNDQRLISQAVNIGEGGCAVTAETEHSIGEQIAIALIFQPSHYAFFSFGEIIDAKACDATLYKYHVRFEPLSEKLSQQLLKHMFQAQTEQKHVS